MYACLTVTPALQGDGPGSQAEEKEGDDRYHDCAADNLLSCTHLTCVLDMQFKL